jgi:L-fuconolactonase
MGDTPLDIVDTQIHLNLTMDEKQALAVMDSLGIQAALIDEFWGHDPQTRHPAPGYVLPNGIFRPTAPGAEFAAARHPDRFSYLLRIDHRDPGLPDRMRLVAETPAARAVRLEARSPEEVDDLRAGRCDPFFEHAERLGLPAFLLSPHNAGLTRRYAAAHPGLAIIVDHFGMPGNEAERAEVLGLAELPNVYLKWAHAGRVFETTTYPFDAAIPFLRKCIDAFGAQRIMWASDFTAINSGHRWADMLFYLRDNEALGTAEREWVLGRTARTVLGWPSPDRPAGPPVIKH